MYLMYAHSMISGGIRPQLDMVGFIRIKIKENLVAKMLQGVQPATLANFLFVAHSAKWLSAQEKTS